MYQERQLTGEHFLSQTQHIAYRWKGLIEQSYLVSNLGVGANGLFYGKIWPV